MILLFPTLIEGISTPKARRAFEAKCHMFYGQRVVDFKGDGATKFAGLENDSDIMDDDGNVIQKKEEKEKEEKGKEKSVSEKNGKKRKKVD